MITDWHFLVLGVGGLGCPAVLGLVAGGARSLTLVDHDRVDASNLHRQVLFTQADVGRPKVDAARDRVWARCPDVGIERIDRRLDPESLAARVSSLGPRTVVLECTDSPRLKFAANDVCLARRVPLVMGAVLRWAGQAMAVIAGRACYRCIYEEPPPAELAPDCAQAGVLGAAAGVVGMWMASLALAVTGNPAVAGRLLALDLLHGGIQQLTPIPRPDCRACAVLEMSSISASDAREASSTREGP